MKSVTKYSSITQSHVSSVSLHLKGHLVVRKHKIGLERDWTDWMVKRLRWMPSGCTKQGLQCGQCRIINVNHEITRNRKDRSSPKHSVSYRSLDSHHTLSHQFSSPFWSGPKTLTKHKTHTIILTNYDLSRPLLLKFKQYRLGLDRNI